MNDIASPLSIMVAEEHLRSLGRMNAGYPRAFPTSSRLHFPPLRRTIGITLIRTGRVLAGAQPNGV